MSISRRFYLDRAKNVSSVPTSITLTPTLSDFGQTVTWTVSSNLISKTLRFEILGANVEHFGNAALSGTLVTNGSGVGGILRNLDKFYEYASNTNVSIQAKIYSLANIELATSTSNILIRQANTFTATGGNITTFIGGVDNLPGQYTVHKFDTAGLANLTVTNIGTYSGANIDIIAIGGGGNGDGGFWTNTNAGLTNAQLTAKELGSYTANAGSGGEGGRVTSTTITNAGFSLANYAIGVGSSTLSSHINTPFSNVIAAGGRTGSTSGSGGSDGVRTYGTGVNPFIWRETSGGGGHGSAGLGSNGSITTGSYGPSNNSGGNGGAGGAGTRITITGSEFYAGGGGGGGTWNPISGALGGLGGGGTGGSRIHDTTLRGTDGLGGGGGGGPARFYGWFNGAIYKTAINYYTNPLDGVSYSGGDGGSGAVYVRYLSKYREMIIL